MTSNAAPEPASGNGPVGVSGPTKSLWLRLLAMSSAASAAALVLTGAAAFIFNGAVGFWSALFGGALVMAFFAISLAVGGFAVVLFVIGAPAWLHGRWFLIGAVVTVVFWQAAEIYGFSKARLQIYNDPDTQKGGTDV